MQSSVRRGLLGGFAAGVVALAVLAAVAVLRTSPTGGDENTMWFAFYSFVAGLPLSLVSEPLARATEGRPDTVAWALMLALVPLNWALIGGIVGLVAGRRGASHGASTG